MITEILCDYCCCSSTQRLLLAQGYLARFRLCFSKGHALPEPRMLRRLHPSKSTRNSAAGPSVAWFSRSSPWPCLLGRPVQPPSSLLCLVTSPLLPSQAAIHHRPRHAGTSLQLKSQGRMPYSKSRLLSVCALSARYNFEDSVGHVLLAHVRLV